MKSTWYPCDWHLCDIHMTSMKSMWYSHNIYLTSMWYPFTCHTPNNKIYYHLASPSRLLYKNSTAQYTYTAYIYSCDTHETHVMPILQSRHSCDVHMAPMWYPYDTHMIPIWHPHDTHMTPTWYLLTCHTSSDEICCHLASPSPPPHRHLWHSIHIDTWIENYCSSMILQPNHHLCKFKFTNQLKNEELDSKNSCIHSNLKIFRPHKIFSFLLVSFIWYL